MMTKMTLINKGVFLKLKHAENKLTQNFVDKKGRKNSEALPNNESGFGSVPGDSSLSPGK